MLESAKASDLAQMRTGDGGPAIEGSSGSAARFFPAFPFTDADRIFYCAKASKADRARSLHPTIKPIKLIEWLIKLVTPPGGTVLDPFSGSGTCGQAARNLGFDCILIEREAEYVRGHLPPARPTRSGHRHRSATRRTCNADLRRRSVRRPGGASVRCRPVRLITLSISSIDESSRHERTIQASET